MQLDNLIKHYYWQWHIPKNITKEYTKLYPQCWLKEDFLLDQIIYEMIFSIAIQTKGSKSALARSIDSSHWFKMEY